MKRTVILLSIFMLFFSFQGKAQNTSNKGKEFYVAYTGHVDGLTSRLTLFLSADQSANYQVFVGPNLIASGSIPVNTSLPVIIDPNQVPVYIGTSDEIEKDKAIRVVTDKAISLYSIISQSARTGGTMVLPVNTLGKEYYTFNYQSSAAVSGGTAVYAEFTILATEDNTAIEIIPTKPEKNGKRSANQSFTINLKKGEIYQYQAVADLSGTYIRSIDGCKPIAVFSGNTWASFCEAGNSRNPSGGDNLYQQMFPISSWGKKFVTAPFYNTVNGNTDILRIIVSENNTTITIDGQTTTPDGTTLSNPYAKGAIVTFSAKQATVISADKPIGVGHYQTSQTCNLNNPSSTNGGSATFPGDPEITVLNPVEQTLSNITVYSRLQGVPTRINRFFINVIIKTVDAPTFRLNGSPISNFVPIDAEYSYRIIDVTNAAAQHRLTANGGFSAITYGYGEVESYAYLAGANIQDFTFQPELAGTAQSVVNGCVGTAINLKINLPYEPTKLEWDVQNGDNLVVQNLPKNVGTVVRNGTTYYTYVYPKPIVYTVPNDYVFKVVATKPSADNCGATEELTVDFTVDPLPSAQIAVAQSACGNQEVTFSSSKSSPNVPSKTITDYYWDFGDGNRSSQPDPIHKYLVKDTTSFKVTLRVRAENGCFSDPVFTHVKVYPQPVALFSSSFNAVQNTNARVISSCARTAIQFKDESIVGLGSTIKEWMWDFGDQTTSSLQNPVHQYAAPGNYTVSLLVKTDAGCESLLFQKTYIITNLPTVDFELPEVCAKDGIAIFKNTSTDYDLSLAGLSSIQWDYGDPASGSLNTSTGVDGNHKYSKPGTYKVVLTVINKNGCRVELKKDFTVNDSSPIADFELVSAGLCSNKSLILRNKSRVDIGSISRLEWYIDGSKVLSDDDPTDGKLYTFNLPAFGGNTDRNYLVKLMVFSGETCANEKQQTFTLKPSPQIVFAALQAVCENDGIVKISAGQEISSQLGTAVYSGKGIKSDGTFDPKVAGVGTHKITYTYTGSNGCDSSLYQNIVVYESPTAYAGQETLILSGTKYRIPASASGKNLKYKWTPSLGLDRDDILNPTASPEEDTEYTLTVSTDQGCDARSKILIKVLGEIHPPTSFSPNGDGVNDVWNINLLTLYPGNTVEIFNRAGQKVFESKGYEIPFDGNFQNKPLPVGVYYYIIAPKNGRKTITGSVTLIR